MATNYKSPSSWKENMVIFWVLFHKVSRGLRVLKATPWTYAIRIIYVQQSTLRSYFLCLLENIKIMLFKLFLNTFLVTPYNLPTNQTNISSLYTSYTHFLIPKEIKIKKTYFLLISIRVTETQTGNLCIEIIKTYYYYSFSFFFCSPSYSQIYSRCPYSFFRLCFSSRK